MMHVYGEAFPVMHRGNEYWCWTDRTIHGTDEVPIPGHAPKVIFEITRQDGAPGTLVSLRSPLARALAREVAEKMAAEEERLGG